MTTKIGKITQIQLSIESGEIKKPNFSIYLAHRSFTIVWQTTSFSHKRINVKTCSMEFPYNCVGIDTAPSSPVRKHKLIEHAVAAMPEQLNGKLEIRLEHHWKFITIFMNKKKFHQTKANEWIHCFTFYIFLHILLLSPRKLKRFIYFDGFNYFIDQLKVEKISQFSKTA